MSPQTHQVINVYDVSTDDKHHHLALQQKTSQSETFKNSIDLLLKYHNWKN